MKLEPKYYVLGELLQRRLFRIPEYQRTYSWGTKQRTDLFNDISALAKSDSDNHHFMATIVCLSVDKADVGADEFEILDVVDGQQRLTSLIVLLKSIAKICDKKDKAEAAIKERIEALLVKGDERLILLQTNHDYNLVYREYIKKGALPDASKLKIEADHNLKQAYLESEKYVHEWKDSKKSIIDLFKIIQNRLGFVFYVLDNERVVYTVFEVLNSRGLDVDWLDKCKSMLMGIAFEKFEGHPAKEHKKNLHDIWQKIYRVLASKNVLGHEILRFSATLIQEKPPNKPLSAEPAYAFFKNICQESSKKVIETASWFSDVTHSLEKLYSNVRLEAVTDISQARLLAVAILQMEIDEKSKIQILSAWEKISYKIFGLLKNDARTGVGAYTKLAHNIHSGNIKSKNDVLQALAEISKKYPIEMVLKGLTKTDCYNEWEKDLRYFLYRYEEHLSAKNGAELDSEIWSQIWRSAPSTTIEHIHPKVRSEGWIGKLGKGRDVLENNIHRLGNLTLLPPKVNSTLQNCAFKEKKDAYKSNFLRMHDEIIRCRDWTIKEINDREERLIEWARITWSD